MEQMYIVITGMYANMQSGDFPLMERILRQHLTECMKSLSNEIRIIGEPSFFAQNQFQFAVCPDAYKTYVDLIGFLMYDYVETMKHYFNVDVIYGVGVGSRNNFNYDDISLSTGDAFTASGKAFDEKRRACGL